ncbi:DUF2617 family protein, partial [Streptomyces carpinensis]
ALLAQHQEGQVHWRTWHAYPQDGQLVATRTRVGARRGSTRSRQPEDAQPITAN